MFKNLLLNKYCLNCFFNSLIIHTMKKMKNVVALVLVAIMMSSCATVFGGPVTASQKRKPAGGEQQRQVRVVALIADIIIFAPSLIVDFATGAIYKPR